MKRSAAATDHTSHTNRLRVLGSATVALAAVSLAIPLAFIGAGIGAVLCGRRWSTASDRLTRSVLGLGIAATILALLALLAATLALPLAAHQ
ncbi:hypothetical protein KXS11_09570 [Plantibacter flavus]|uniref:hypothetical protein n=1 Tax=Plantibacter flavus TaxID=150123 RepID=UPI003F16B8BC